MKVLHKALLVVAVSAVLGGCSSSPNEELYDRLADMEEQRLEIEQARLDIETEKREQEIKLLPSWVLDPPKMDATGVYGVGIAKSKDIGFGLKSARLQAEFELSKSFGQEMSGSERSFQQGGSEGDVAAQTTFLIDKIVDAVPVVGYEVVEQEAVIIDGQHQFFVLLKMPFDQFNKVLQMERAKELDTKVLASFDDLERRLDKRRTQKAEEAQADFERNQEALRSRGELLNAQSEPTEPQR